MESFGLWVFAAEFRMTICLDAFFFLGGCLSLLVVLAFPLFSVFSLVTRRVHCLLYWPVMLLHSQDPVPLDSRKMHHHLGRESLKGIHRRCSGFKGGC